MTFIANVPPVKMYFSESTIGVRGYGQTETKDSKNHTGHLKTL